VTYGSVGSGLNSVSVSRLVKGLECNVDYQVRARAVNSAGTAMGNTQSFTTRDCGLFNDRFENAP
jgi:hypothetical protein